MVYNEGTFFLRDGSIRDNRLKNNNTAFAGGGVYSTGTFTMSGGNISGNSATAQSTHNGDAYVSGGGVYAIKTFTMGGGVYCDNRASDHFFSMSGGIISGNTARLYGGGVYGGIRKTGGIIYGNDAAESLQNIALVGAATGNNKGHAAYGISGSQYRDKTAGESVNLESLSGDETANWGE